MVIVPVFCYNIRLLFVYMVYAILDVQCFSAVIAPMRQKKENTKVAKIVIELM